jgi:adenine nucleotide transporter 17
MGKGEDGVGTLLSYTTLAHAVSGSVGSIIAMGLTYPLDRVRTLKQLGSGKDSRGVVDVLRGIVREEGWAGLYSGLQPMLIALGCSNFVYFYFFTALRAALQYMLRRRAGAQAVSDGGPLGSLLLASVAGTINVLITTPLWVAYTRLAVQSMNLLRQAAGAGAGASAAQFGAERPYGGLWDAMTRIAAKDGLASLWSGTGPSLILVSNPSVQFASYEWMKKVALHYKLNSEPISKDLAHFGDILDDDSSSLMVCSESVTGSTDLSSAEYLILGAAAKMIATVVTYPLQVAQTYLRAQNSRKDDKGQPSGQRRYSSTMDCLRGIYAADGIAGLYRGMDAKLLQTCLTSAFMFTAYEQIVALILRALLWNKYRSNAVGA